MFIDDFQKAKNKLKQCQYSSDIAPEVEQLPDKRQSNKPSRYQADDSSDEENELLQSKLKPPPRFNIILKNDNKRETIFGNNIICHIILHINFTIKKEKEREFLLHIYLYEF